MLRRKGSLTSRRIRNGSASESASETEKSSSRAGHAPTAKSLGAVMGTYNPTSRQISDRAYYIYLARGGVGGDPMTDWLRAERELREARRNAADSAR